MRRCGAAVVRLCGALAVWRAVWYGSGGVACQGADKAEDECCGPGREECGPGAEEHETDARRAQPLQGEQAWADLVLVC